MTEQKSIKIN